MTGIICAYFVVGIFLTIFIWVTDKESIFNKRDHFFMIIIWPYFVFCIVLFIFEDIIAGYQYDHQKKRRKK